MFALSDNRRFAETIVFDSTNGDFAGAYWRKNMQYDSLSCSSTVPVEHAEVTFSPYSRSSTLEADLKGGKVLGDVIWGQNNFELLVSNQLLDRMNEHGFSGFKAQTCSLWKNGVLVQDKEYSEVLVEYNAALDYKSSGFEAISACPKCKYVQANKLGKGLNIINGGQVTDFCKVIEYPFHILISERVKEFLVGSRIAPIVIAESRHLLF